MATGVGVPGLGYETMQRMDIHFDAGHNGPPRVVQGGTLAGRMAEALGGAAEVTLRRPAPLATPLRIERRDDTAVLRRDNDILAEARRFELDLDTPAPPSFNVAEAASRRYVGHERHPFPSCWVCGTERAHGDGMRIFAGPVRGTRSVAAIWTPAPKLATAMDRVWPEYLWAALDCPGGWAAITDIEPRPIVLGRIAARIERPVHAGIPYIVTAWKLETEGRKHLVGSAIFTAAGVRCAFARATWLDVDATAWS